MLANTSVEKPIKQNVHNIRNKRTRGSWSRFIIYQFLQFKLCFIFGFFLVFHLGNFVQGASLNHVDQFLDKFDPPSPLWTILLNKGYGLMWTFVNPLPLSGLHGLRMTPQSDCRDHQESYDPSMLVHQMVFQIILFLEWHSPIIKTCFNFNLGYTL